MPSGHRLSRRSRPSAAQVVASGRHSICTSCPPASCPRSALRAPSRPTAVFPYTRLWIIGVVRLAPSGLCLFLVPPAFCLYPVCQTSPSLLGLLDHKISVSSSLCSQHPPLSYNPAPPHITPPANLRSYIPFAWYPNPCAVSCPSFLSALASPALRLFSWQGNPSLVGWF